MGIYDSIIHTNKQTAITPSPNHYDRGSFESSIILPKNNNLSKNLKEMLSASIVKKNTSKLNMPNTNTNISYLAKQSYSKNNKLKNEKNIKISFINEINTLKTFDKKISNNKNQDTNNNKNTNTSNVYTTSYKNSFDKKKISCNRDESKKFYKSNEKIKSININNINIHNKSNKDVKPFYYKPKNILNKVFKNLNHRNNTTSNYSKTKLRKNKGLKNLALANSIDKMLTKNGSIKNLNNMAGSDIHRSYNNISRISSKDKLNILNNNFGISNKINYKLEQVIDVHDYYNDSKNKPLYIIDDISELYQNKKDNMGYSTENDYNEIIRNNKDPTNINKIYLELLRLKERKWQDDLINISQIISTIRKSKNKNQEININYILNKILLLFDHFNWILNSISYYFSSIVYINKNEQINYYNYSTLNFPGNDSFIWFKGFKWKGLYIRIEKDINCVNKIKKEIKALNYFFLDYIHILWNNELLEDFDIYNKINILSNNIVFPLIGYCQINSFVLIVSSIIIPESKNINLDELLKKSNRNIDLISNVKIIENNNSVNKVNNTTRFQNKNNIYNNNFSLNSININEFNKKQNLLNKLNHSLDYKNNDKRSKSTYNNNSKIDLNNNEENNNRDDITFFKNDYFINDLLSSKLFSNINKNNLIKIKKGKFILLNLSEYLPNLFENHFKNNIKKINFYGKVDGENKYVTLNYNYSLLINLKNIIEPKNIHNKKPEYYNTLTPKIVLEKIYKLYLSPELKLKNVIIGNMIFRILYFNSQKNQKTLKPKFVDLLFNYNIEIQKKINISTNLLDKKENVNDYVYIQEPYVIIYDIIEPIKLDYSLIKSIKTKSKDSELIEDIFFMRTNYIDYFMSWCDMFNKNSFNIKRYRDLKYYMKKFGINQILLFFALFKINNEEITDLIKIHLLVKSFKFVCFYKDNEIVLKQFMKDVKYKDLNIYGTLKSKIFYYIKSVLYPNEILPSYQKLFKSIYKHLLFFSNILFFKFKLIDDYLFLGILNSDKNTINKNKKFYSFFNIQSPKEFLNHCILIARKKPFLFISELEYKLNFVIDPFIKFKSSISLESMSHQLDISHLELNNIIVKSYIDPNEISGLILTKIIQKYKEKEKNSFYNNDYFAHIKNNNENNISSKYFDLEAENTELKINNVIYSSKPNKKTITSYNKTNIMSSKKETNKTTNYNMLPDDLEIGFDIENKEENKNNIKIYNNKNNFIPRNNNSNDNHNYYLYDSNDVLTKMSSDKTMDEAEILNTKLNKNITKNNNLSKLEPINFKEISENIIFPLPANCHKILFNYEKNKVNKNSNYLYPNLTQYYIIKNIQIIKEWISINENIFRTIINSHNFSLESNLIKSYIILFLYTFYIERSPKDFNRISNKILSLFKNNYQYYLSLNEISMINLVQALSNNSYIQNEEYFSKCVMLLLLNYGDPRGRYNDSHGVLQFPLWEIARKTYKLDETIINENFKEMYQSLDFFEKMKGIYNVSSKNNNDMYKYDYVLNIQLNMDKIKILYLKDAKNAQKKEDKNTDNNNNDVSNDTESVYSMINNIDESPNENNINRNITDLDIFLSKSFFDRNCIEKICIPHYIFPSISSKIENVGRVFYRKEFIIYIIKEILSLFLNRGTIFNKKYLDNIVSNELISVKNIIINSNKAPINQEKTRDNSKNTKNNDETNQTPIKKKDNNNQNIEKIPNSSLRANPYLKLDKKYNNRNILNYETNNNFGTKSSKSYNNCVNKGNASNKSSKQSKNYNIIVLSKIRKTINNRNEIIKNDKNTTNNKNDSNNNNTNNIKTKKLFSHFLYNELFQKLSYKKNLPSGIVISCGNNKHNETSHDRYEKLTLPRVIFKLKNEIINKIYSGWEHNIVLNNKGEIFSFGHNQYYQCGLPNLEKNSMINGNINDPTNISKLYNNIKAIKVSCGNEHTLIIAKDQNVYGFGNNEGGLLGFQDNKIKTYKPLKINFVYKINTNKIENYDGKMIDISCGTMHNLALTNDGKVFAWGSIQGGQLGLSYDLLLKTNNNSEQNFYISTPTPIPYFLNNNIKISQISCGEAHSLALNNKGKVYSWGFGTNGQLGLGFCEDCFEPGQGLVKSRIFEPQLIHTFKDYDQNLYSQKNNISCNNIKIKEIKSGKTFSMFISNNNELFACGINDLGQLGFKDLEKKEKLYNPEIQCDDYIYPSLLKCFDKKIVEKISCGEGHCLAIIKDLNSNIQSLWSWGSNKYGQIGHGMMVKISLPKEVEYLTDYNMNNFSDISCGGFHSLILLKSKNNLEWIEKDYEEYILGIFKDIGDL